MNIIDIFGICNVFLLTRSFTIKTIDMKIYVKKKAINERIYLATWEKNIHKKKLLFLWKKKCNCQKDELVYRNMIGCFQKWFRLFNPFQSSVAFHIETSDLTCIANQMTGFYMRWKTGLKLVNRILTNVPFCVNASQHSGATVELWKALTHFFANVPLFISPGNTWKPNVFWCFHEA